MSRSLWLALVPGDTAGTSRFALAERPPSTSPGQACVRPYTRLLDFHGGDVAGVCASLFCFEEAAEDFAGVRLR